MVRQLVGSMAGALVLMSLVVSSALASITFDPATGEGFIGRGDVIDALGKDGLVLHPVVTYVDEAVYQQTCSKEVEVGKAREIMVITHTFKREFEINAEVLVETRVNRGSGNITGYNLQGYADDVDAGSIPTNLCPAQPSGFSPDGPVELVSASGGTLYFDAGWGPIAIWTAS